MQKKTISVTEAARNFADCVNRAHYQGTTFMLVKNGSPVARLGPAGEKTCSGRDLAEVVVKSRLPDREIENWRRDLAAARKAAKAPDDKWT